MSPMPAELSSKSRLAVLLEHFGTIDDPRDVRRISHPLAEVLLLVVCGTIADCDDYDHIAAWGEAHVDFLRRHLPYENGVPGGRWLTILMNRINPALFSAAFTGWVRATWPNRPDFVAIDGKTSRRGRRGEEHARHVFKRLRTSLGRVAREVARKITGTTGEARATSPTLRDRIAQLRRQRLPRCATASPS